MQTEHQANRWKVCLLGAINGLLYSGLTYAYVERYNKYLFELNLKEAERLNITPGLVMGIAPRWPVVAVVLTLLFVAATFLACRYWRGSPGDILFWEVIGIVALSSWHVIAFTVLWVEKESTGQKYGYESMISLANPLFGPKSFALVLVTNLLYALFIKSVSKRTLRLG